MAEIVLSKYIDDNDSKIGILKNLLTGRTEDKFNRYIKCSIGDMTAYTEFYYYISSRTIYEDQSARITKTPCLWGNSKTKTSRQIISDRSGCIIDTNFSLYKNMFYDRADVNSHVEINFCYEIPKMIYYNFGEKFNEASFVSQYTEFEYYVLIDLFTCIVMGIITPDEFETFRVLVSKDKCLNSFCEEAISTYEEEENLMVVSVWMLGQKVSKTVSVLSEIEVLKEMLCLLMLPIVYSIVKSVTKSQGEIILKAVNDFRYIFLIKDYVNSQFRIRVTNGISNNSTIVTPRVFRGKEALHLIAGLQEQVEKDLITPVLRSELI